jgi:hypothetical protein
MIIWGYDPPGAGKPINDGTITQQILTAGGYGSYLNNLFK